MSRMLQAIGILALAAWTIGGFLAWRAATRDVRLVVEDRAASAPDPELALLADRSETLSEDVRALAHALRAHLGELAQRIERLEAAADSDELRAVAIEQARLREHVERLAASLESAGRAEFEPAAEEPEPVAEVPAVGEERPAAVEAKKSFLAFRLPSEDFAFDELRRFTILSALSRVGFDGKSTLHDFTGVTRAVTGEIETNLARPAERLSGSIAVDARTLDTGNGDRDEDMREQLDVERHGSITFELGSIDAVDVDAAARTVRGTVRGRMTIRGVPRDVEMPVRARIDESRRLAVQGEMPLRLPDYGVPVPKKLGLIKMEEEVRVWIDLVARPVPARRAE